MTISSSFFSSCVTQVVLRPCLGALAGTFLEVGILGVGTSLVEDILKADNDQAEGNLAGGINLEEGNLDWEAGSLAF